MLIEREPDSECSDLAMMRRWQIAFVSGDPIAHRMILLEAEARLLRLARNLPATENGATSGATGLFRRTCGLTVLEYLTIHRVWHAQHLFTAGAMKVRGVAQACGFNSPNRFYAALKRLVGKLPTDFRESLTAGR